MTFYLATESMPQNRIAIFRQEFKIAHKTKTCDSSNNNKKNSIMMSTH